MNTDQRAAAQQFLRACVSRSQENTNSLAELVASGNYGTAISLLRQEIDTFVRLAFLDSQPLAEAIHLLQQFVAHQKWCLQKGGKKHPITDREMVDLATKRYFWVEIAYRLSCSLIHLSTIHDYRTVDPFRTISPSDRATIIEFLHDFYGYRDSDIDLPRFIHLLPRVMGKISDKVKEYSDKLTGKFVSSRTA
jgi:hypothetical protein